MITTNPFNPGWDSVSSGTAEVQVDDYHCQEGGYGYHDHVQAVIRTYKPAINSKSEYEWPLRVRR